MHSQLLPPKFEFPCYTVVPYSTYYKPMGDLPYISSEQGGLIISSEFIYEYTAYKRPIPIQEVRAEEGGWAYPLDLHS